MLTLKEPLKLKTARPITAYTLCGEGGNIIADAFCNRISQNYSVMNANLTAEDLFFLVSTPPEIPAFFSDSASFNIQQNIGNKHEFSLNILNSVVNRILLANNSKYTYQDEVYISSVLRKIGITDVLEFMRQVKELREDNRSVYNLLKLYQKNIPEYKNKQTGERTEQLRTVREKDSEQIKLSETPRYTIHNEIYKRLQTAEMYHIINNYTGNKTDTSNQIKTSEIRTIEQFRVGNLIQFSEMKQRFTGTDSNAPELQHVHINRYETGESLPVPVNERQVIEQSTAGALLNLIDNVFTARLDNISNNQNLWTDISNIVYHAAEKSLARFQMFRTYKTNYSTEDRIISNKIKELTLKEEALLTKISREFSDFPLKAVLPLFQDNDYQAEAEKTEKFTSEEADKIQVYNRYRELLREINREKSEIIFTGYKKSEEQKIFQSEKTEINYLTSNFSKRLSQQNLDSENLHISYENNNAVNRFNDTAVAEYTELINKSGEAFPQEEREEKVFDELKQQLDEYDRKNKEAAEKLMLKVNGLGRSGEDKADAVKLAEKQREAAEIPPNVLKEVFGVSEITHVKNQPFSGITPEEHLKIITEQTKKTTQEQLLMQQDGSALQSRKSAKEKKTESKKAKDINPETLDFQHKPVITEEEIDLSGMDETTKLIYESLLKQQHSNEYHLSFSESEKQFTSINNEISETKEDRQIEFTHMNLLPEEEAVLSVADETTKLIYRSLLQQVQNDGYDNSEEQAEKQVAIFNAEIRKAEKHSSTELFHKTELLKEETQSAYEKAETFTEKMRFIKEKPAYQPNNFRKPALTVHKQTEQQGLPEELIERLTQAQNRTEIKTETINTETNANQTVNETQIHKLIQEQTAKSTEDITSLVNSTIAKQMSVISEKVYSSMERRLSLERARRGKF
ncbi:MAG: hypothetical protein FWG44_02225 [Oscillospiraceae bacterium]|nr:hypothetical protein [Oscillospiraceae bacterium]